MTRSLLALVALCVLPAIAFAQSAAPTDATKAAAAPAQPQQARALFVLNARAAKLVGQTLVLEQPMPSAIVFADRPIRRAGHAPTSKIVQLWSTGSFAKDPPNATVSVFRKDGGSISDAVVVLKDPKLENDRLSFTVAVLEGSLADADGPASVFIDTIWFGVGGDGIHYLGQNRTNGGISPNVGDPDTAYTGWSNPAPDGSAPRPSYQQNNLTTPPDAQGNRKCGAPPLLPCY